jgi:hypothetical protein
VLITIVMLAIQYGGASAVAGDRTWAAALAAAGRSPELVGTSAAVATYAVYQCLLVAALAALARRHGVTQRSRPPRAASYLALTLAVVPLVLVKFRPELDSWIGFLGVS